MSNSDKSIVAMQPLATRAEIASLLRISKAFLDHAAGRGDGPPFYRIGRAVRYDYGKVRSWLDAKLGTGMPELEAEMQSGLSERRAERTASVAASVA